MFASSSSPEEHTVEETIKGSRRVDEIYSIQNEKADQQWLIRYAAYAKVDYSSPGDYSAVFEKFPLSRERLAITGSP